MCMILYTFCRSIVDSTDMLGFLSRQMLSSRIIAALNIEYCYFTGHQYPVFNVGYYKTEEK
jgi:hypothetical protein